MNKILVERPRVGGIPGPKRPKHRYVDPDNDPSPQQQGMRRRHFYWRKSLNENLSPLWRFLESRVGRPWNNVFAEIAANFDASKTINHHIYQHLLSYVETRHVVYLDGKYYHSSPSYISDSRNRWLRPMEESWVDFFVDIHGILRRNKRKPRRRYRHAPDPDRREVNDAVYVRRKGVWFEELRDVVRRRYRTDETGVVSVWNEHVYRQLSTRELRKLGVTNE